MFPSSKGKDPANYTYLANSPLVEQTPFKDGATVRRVTTRKYDSLNRLTSIGSGTSASATPHTAYNYAYNAANQRIQTTQHDTSYWVYEYDALGQVISGKRFWADGTLVAGQQFEYRFDDIGNRTQTQTGGDLSGQNLRVAAYTANGLKSLTSLANTPTGSKFQLSFVYDSLGRRIQKTVATNNGTAYVTLSTNRFLYDGWNVTAQLEGSTGFGARLYLWGLDLSGSEQGAGGVGGLVAQGPASSGLDRFVAYDGNGNVTGMTSATDGSLTAQYEYTPSGELQRGSGVDWQKNPFRFSTKVHDDESDLLYYGYRYYLPGQGRWISRDPIGSDGGDNEFAFVENNPISQTDILGLQCHENCSCGGDVTKLVSNTLRDISRKYHRYFEEQSIGRLLQAYSTAVGFKFMGHVKHTRVYAYRN